MKKSFYGLFLFLIFLVLVFYMWWQADNNKMASLRKAVSAGVFYPSNSAELSKKISDFLDSATSTPKSSVRALIVPHAGYDYSGQTATIGYKTLLGRKPNTVVIISNSHDSLFAGAVADDHDIWATPLGKIAVDKELINKLVADSEGGLKKNSHYHQTSHIIEVQLPFLQTVLNNNFKIVPIIFGNQDNEDYKKIAKSLAKNLGQADLVVVSSDMSHYLTYAEAQTKDEQTLIDLKQGQIGKISEENDDGGTFCGIDGVKTVLTLARQLNWSAPEVLDYRNSGDVLSGDKDRVVGYSTAVFNSLSELEEKPALSLMQGQDLLKLARSSLESYIKNGQRLEIDKNDLTSLVGYGAFVTLKTNNDLRGCIGVVENKNDPLPDLVGEMAISAGIHDNRFKPVGKNDLDKITYEVSVLSRPKKVKTWRDIELGQQGVIVKKGNHSGVFLPQVATETNWDIDQFLSELCSQKAGLPADCYKNDPEVELLVFTAQVFSE